jgi:two-component system sensor histidine kinase EvgS
LGAWVDAVLDHRLGTEENVTPELGPATDVTVKAAPDAFRVVLENLLDNARKYGGGSVRIEARVEEKRVALDVVDEGVGFEPHMAEAIFEPYQRGERVEKRHGTGLGLYIARTLARSVGGELEARSDGEGKGATFTFWLARG